MFFYTKNLTEKELHTGLDPWDFKLTEVLTAQIRGDKQERQNWYRNITTNHYFYTLIEPVNPNMRPSKENTPFKLHGFAVDYDAKIPASRVTEAMTAFPVKPTHVERSLGGNLRLVWLFSEPLRVENYEFCHTILSRAVKWLNLGLLPGLDEPAFVDPTRLLCNGCQWEATGAPPVPADKLQAFYVDCGKEYRFRPSDGNKIPLDVVEKALKEKFPAFSWPGEFAEGVQGPSFWVEGSVSAMSAIVKAEGMFTFSAHADKPFYSWGDILGQDFVKQFATTTVNNATNDIWFDGKHYWKKNAAGVYQSNSKDSMLNFFKVSCKLSDRPGKDGTSAVDNVLNHLEHGPGRIVGAAPFIFQPSGLLDFQGEKKLNICNRTVMKPADELTPWGPTGKFPFTSAHFERFFQAPEQLPHFLAWWKAFYLSGLTLKPYPGQNVFFMGGVNVGKTLSARGYVGLSVGGFVDASEFLIHGGGFNSELLEVPLWCSDDETMSESTGTQNTFQAMMKKIAANQEHRYSKKYEIPCMVTWMGRIIVTCNLDFISSRTLGMLDNSSLDKTHLFLCARETSFVFPNRYDIMRIILAELPYFLRWLLEWTPPPEVIPDARYGYKAYHHPDLIDQAHQSSKAAPFKELLVESLKNYFIENPQATEWRGTETALNRMLHGNPMNDCITRMLRMEQISRYLEMIQKEGIVTCSVTTGDMKTRIWVFPRIGAPPASKPPEEPPMADGKSIFEK